MDVGILGPPAAPMTMRTFLSLSITIVGLIEDEERLCGFNRFAVDGGKPN